ncbi:MAG: hypothetical protein ACK5OX_13165 [Desertimonas sp.]
MADLERPGPAEIRLDIPADARHVATARLVAASAGVDAGLNLDELDDVRLGIDELAALLVARAGAGARLTITAEVQPGRLVLHGGLDGAVDPRADPSDALSERIVAAVADHYELGEHTFRLEKSATDGGG